LLPELQVEKLKIVGGIVNCVLLPLECNKILKRLKFMYLQHSFLIC